MMPRVRLGVSAALSIGVVLVAALIFGSGACQVGTIQTDRCDKPDWDHNGKNGQLDQCHCQDPDSAAGLAVGGRSKTSCCVCTAPESESGNCSFTDSTCVCPYDSELGENICPEGVDAGGPTGACGGECLPSAPLFWTAPLLLWLGDEVSAPACPATAPILGFEGHAGLNATAASCAACTCEPSVGTCALPAAMTASAATCATTGPATVLTPSDPPAAWDGACTSEGAVVAGVQSLTIAPLLMSGSCAPVEPPVPLNHTSSWSSLARACTFDPGGECAAQGEVCSPWSSPPEGFRLCVAHPGDVDCPGVGGYVDRHVAYEGIDDTRGCTPCACGAPAGSGCSALISVFEDGACSAPDLVVAATVTAAGSSCFDVPLGSTLGSKSASVVAYTPGACEPSGGEPMGSAEPALPVTFCCLA